MHQLRISWLVWRVELFLLGARVVLVAVFAFAAVAKLADTRSSALVRSGAVAEAVLAAALLSNGTAQRAAGGASVILVGGAGWALAKLARGRRVPCRCFGRWSPTELGWHEVARNGSLAVLAGVVVGRGSEAAPGIATWCVVGGVGGVLALGLMALGYGRRRAALRLVGRMVS